MSAVASHTQPKLELIYFPMRARGDVIRRILIEAGLTFAEIRVDMDDSWPSRKLEFPFGQLPVLRVDDGRLLVAQSHAIARYAARLTGNAALLGDSLETAALVDMWYYQAEDVFAEFIPPFYLAPDTVDQMLTDKWSRWMAPFERVLSGADRPYLAGGPDISLADYHFLDVLDMAFAYEALNNNRLGLRQLTPVISNYHSCLSQRPGLQRFAEHVKHVRFTLDGPL